MAWNDHLESFLGQPWSNWTDFLGSSSPTEPQESQCVYQPPTSAVKLRKKGMDIFGFHLERDQFSMVVCETCQKLVKPEVLKSHVKSRHSKVTAPKSPLTKSFQATVKSSNTKVRLKKSAIVISKADSTTVPAVNDTNNNMANLNCSVNVVDTTVVSSSATSELVTPVGSVSNNSMESEPTNSDILDSYENPVSSEGSNASALASQMEMQVTEAVNMNMEVDTVASSPVFPSPVSVSVSLPLNNIPSLINVPATAGKGRVLRASRRSRSAREKEYDADRHCGVLINDKPCKRSLTCSLHTMPLRRAVEGRTKSFNQLLAEHRATKDPMVVIKKADLTLLNNPPSTNGTVKVDSTIGNLGTRASKGPTVHASTSITSGTVTVDSGSLRIPETIFNPPVVTVQEPPPVEPCVSEVLALAPSDTTDNSMTSPPSFVIVNRTQIVTRPAHVTLSSFSKGMDVNKAPAPTDVSTVLDIVVTSSHPKPLAVGGLFNHGKIGGLLYCHRKFGMARHFFNSFKDI